MFERIAPKVSIVIPSWFKPGQHGKYGENETYWFAQECIKRLVKVTPKELYELIIIDNGSTLVIADLYGPEMEPRPVGWEDTDENKDLIRDPHKYWAYADVLIRNKENLGFGPACNQGFALARGEFVICLNNDILVWPNWLERILEPFSKQLDPPAGIVMPALVHNLRDAREAIKLEKVDETTHAGIYGPGAEFGSLWVIKRSVMDELKRKDGFVFDENFKLGMGEDRDLWDRIRLLGYQTYRTHDVRVFHQGNMSIGKFPDRKDYTVPNREYLANKRKNRENKIT